MDTLTITLSGTQYVVQKLTLRQARAVGVGIGKLNGTDDPFGASLDQAVAVVAAALSRTNPEITEATLWESEHPWRELTAARDDILVFSGFAKPRSEAVGEADPAAASTGPG